MTVADFIKTGLRTIGIIASGETPSAADTSDGLEILNRMLGSWSTDGFLVYENKRETFPLVSGIATYTFGTGGDFNSARPQIIDYVRVQKDSIEYKVEIVNEQRWSEIGLKSLQSNFPSVVFLSGTFPLETINLWPVPNEANSLVIYSQKPLTKFASTSDTISWPEGYEEAVLYNFAVRLSPEYGKPIDAGMLSLANELKANLKRKNAKPLFIKNDSYGRRLPYYNIYKGPFR